MRAFVVKLFRIVPWLFCLVLGLVLLLSVAGIQVSKTATIFVAYYALAFGVMNGGFWVFNKLIFPRHSGHVQDAILEGNWTMTAFYAVVYFANMMLAMHMFRP